MTTTEQSFATAPQLTETLKKYQQISAFVGLVGLVALAAAFFLAGVPTALRSYLVGFWMWMGAGVGCLGLLMLQYLSGGAWGVIIRKPCEAGAKTLWVMMFGFLPLLIFVHDLYWWTTPAGQADKRIQEKHLYLNIPFLWTRWGIYTIFFCGVTYLLAKWSRQEDETKSMAVSSRLEKLSAPSMIALFFLMTFCAVDYLMTLEPHWYSTMYGFIVVIGEALTAMCLMVAALVMLTGYAPMEYAVTKKHLHDLGKLMLALTMLWAYTNFGQLLITWSGNLPDEIVWYVKRWNGAWGWLSVIVWVFHFFLPFALLLSQSLKRNKKTIWRIAVFIVAIHAVDVYYMVQGNFVNTEKPELIWSTLWIDAAAVIGFGGLWLALFFRNLAAAPTLLPVGAPDFRKALDHGRSH